MPANTTMYDYLSWRGDLLFSQDPFNEVDNMILAQLSYVDFDDIVSDDREEKISIGDVCRLYWEQHTEEEIRKRESFVKLSPFLLRPVAESRRFRNMVLTGYVNYISASSEAQMSAVQFELEDGTVYVAFRGTDETVVGWKEDFNLSFMPQTEGQRLAVEYMKIYFRDTDLRLRVGGHSKGGNFAIYASAFSGPEIERQVEQVFTNDGPGFLEEVTQTPEYRRVLAKTISIIPADSVIGRLLDSDLQPRVVKSSAVSIMQHDAMTWQVMGNRFVRAERTENSQFIEKVLTDWLNKVDDESRRVLVDQIFSVMQATGAETMKGVRTANLQSLTEAIQFARNLPKEDRKEITQVFAQLLRSGERTLYEQIENNEGNIPTFIRKWAAKRGDKIEQKELEEEQALVSEGLERVEAEAKQELRGQAEAEAAKEQAEAEAAQELTEEEQAELDRVQEQEQQTEQQLQVQAGTAQQQ